MHVGGLQPKVIKACPTFMLIATLALLLTTALALLATILAMSPNKLGLLPNISALPFPLSTRGPTILASSASCCVTFPSFGMSFGSSARLQGSSC
ncbi:hypothetical protein AMTR_s00098p00064380 [Amborella trichopoda]|uniref:Uncharacterized protein n=1 Tax=Amborella trichopoda TaxID=13333 RepID=W1NW35_AMBTC|nr:hypothetical protein AMTR_s00098p00064380 [Amborella trichopoda]